MRNFKEKKGGFSFLLKVYYHVRMPGQISKDCKIYVQWKFMQIPVFTVHVEICYRKISRKGSFKIFQWI